VRERRHVTTRGNAWEEQQMAMTVERAAAGWKRPMTSASALRDLVGAPSEMVIRKELSALDIHCRDFIARSPFVLLGTSGANGTCDVSPKGDAPGFVLVRDDTTLVIPDRKGNRRIDSLLNIIDNPHVGLLFLVPGVNETLRVNGVATLIQDEDMLEQMAVGNSLPVLGIAVTVQQCFLHCAKSFMRAKLWEPSGRVERSALPSLARILLDQQRPAGRSDEEHERLIQEREAAIAQAYQSLY